MTPGEVADVLETSGQAFASLLRGVTPEVASWRPAPEEWCVNECVGHIIESEQRGFAGRVRIILGADEPKLEGWDQAGSLGRGKTANGLRSRCSTNSSHCAATALRWSDR